MLAFRCIVLLWFCFIKAESQQQGETFVGIRRGSDFDFDLPRDVAVNVQDDHCDAEWTADQSIAYLEGQSIVFNYPFKNVTRHGISVSYCPLSVKYHVSCSKYTKELTFSCTNHTNSNPSFSTTKPSTDISPSSFKMAPSVRNHYVTIAVVATFVLVLFILPFLIYHKQTASADENKKLDFVQVT